MLQISELNDHCALFLIMYTIREISFRFFQRMIHYSPKVTFSSPSNGPRRCRVVCLSSFPQIFICLCYTGRLKLSVKVSNTIFDKALPHCRPSVPAWLERPPFTAGQLSTPQTLSHSVSINPCTAMSLRTTSKTLKPITVSVFFFLHCHVKGFSSKR